MYHIARHYLRIPKDKFIYSKNDRYIYVDNGFFDVQNFFTPLPIGFFIIITHLLCFYGIYVVIDQNLYHIASLVVILNFWAGFGITAGAHRLWSHRSFKARLPLKIFFMLGESSVTIGSASDFAIGHRIHHKYSDTDSDPHNSKRGFFYAHIGWFLSKEHPDIQIKEKQYSFHDLLSDPILSFQSKYYWLLLAVMGFIAPVILIATICQVTLWNAILINMIRMISVLHTTAFVNSAAHMFGDRPYCPEIEARENYFVALSAIGEGYHNYHHTYPRDYRTGELGSGFNLTCKFIDLMKFFGQVSDLQITSPDVIELSKSRLKG